MLNTDLFPIHTCQLRVEHNFFLLNTELASVNSRNNSVLRNNLELFTPHACPEMPTTPQHSVTVSDESVCVRVELPLVNKAGEVDLNISPERLHLIVGDVELDMALPHKVKDEEAAAKFDKKAHVLTLTMPRASMSSAPTPMTPPTAPPPAPAPVPAPAPAPAPPPTLLPRSPCALLRLWPLDPLSLRPSRWRRLVLGAAPPQPP